MHHTIMPIRDLWLAAVALACPFRALAYSAFSSPFFLNGSASKRSFYSTSHFHCFPSISFVYFPKSQCIVFETGLMWGLNVILMLLQLGLNWHCPFTDVRLGQASCNIALAPLLLSPIFHSSLQILENLMWFWNLDLIIIFLNLFHNYSKNNSPLL